MDNYIRYKPLRNLLRQHNVQASLEDVWYYFQVLEGNLPMERVWNGQRVVAVKEYVFKWELAILARELALHATRDGKLRLRPWEGLRRLVNMLRTVDNDMALDNRTPQSAYESLSPTGQLQFPWQRSRHFNSLMRYFKVFAAPDVEALLVKQTGVSTWEWFFVGFAASGVLRSEFGVSSTQDYSAFGIEVARSKTVFDKLSQPLEELQEKVKVAARYDETWMYTWNPLEAKPFVALNPALPNRLHCPAPPYVLRRVSQGLFYEIAAADNFNNPFGASFQAYVGEVLDATFPKAQFTVYEEREYKVGRNRKDGVDWILADDQANIFIECKAKRMTQGAKSAVDPTIIGQQVDFLAKAVIQLYKNIADALAGHTQWQPNDRPVYPMVVTLEDWFLFGTAADLLREGVRTKMEEEQLDLSWLDSMPYTVASCEDFEDVTPTIAEVGIGAFFEPKRTGYQTWMLQTFAREHFPDIYRRTVHRDLFRDEWVRILPASVLPFEVKGQPTSSDSAEGA